jgi:alpha-methylacyl-CoA racemase
VLFRSFHDSPFYDAYECADGKAITIGALEPQFYAVLMEKLGLSDVPLGKQYDSRTWPELKQRLTALFKSKPRAAWCELLEGTEACFAPVLTLEEAAAHPHNIARQMYHDDGRQIQAAAAPRFSADQTDHDLSVGADDTASKDAVLLSLGLTAERIAELKTAGIVG